MLCRFGMNLVPLLQLFAVSHVAQLLAQHAISWMGLGRSLHVWFAMTAHADEDGEGAPSAAEHGAAAVILPLVTHRVLKTVRAGSSFSQVRTLALVPNESGDVL